MSKPSDLKAFRQAALKLVNFKRSLHGAAPLRASNKLDASAQLWAETLAGKTALENSAEAQKGAYGESISGRSSKTERVDITAEEVINQWYDERSNFNFKDGTGTAGNFTQMVWMDSFKVGFGKAHASGRVIVVAHYFPAGNYRNQYIHKVKPDSSTAVDQLTGDLAGFRVTMREMLRDEEVAAGGRPIIIERERVVFEDAKGNTKEKIYERRREKPKLASDEAQNADDSAKAEFRKGSILPIKEKELTKFSKELLGQVNKHRSKHGAKSLKLNSEMCSLAQSFAEELSRMSKLYNSGATFKGDRLGESIASRWSNGPTDYAGEEVADHWYAEVEKYHFNGEPTDIKGVGNFTQMVWKNSKELGVGKAIHQGTDGSHRAVVVCYYYPAGNVVPCFLDNVQPPAK